MLANVKTMLARPLEGLDQKTRDYLGGFTLLLVLILFPLLTDDDANVDAVATAASYAVLALGLNIVVGFTGLLDLGYAAFFAIGAYYYGIFTAYQVMPLWTDGWAPLLVVLRRTLCV